MKEMMVKGEIIAGDPRRNHFALERVLTELLQNKPGVVQELEKKTERIGKLVKVKDARVQQL
jgi:hypothetical protein